MIATLLRRLRRFLRPPSRPIIITSVRGMTANAIRK